MRWMAIGWKRKREKDQSNDGKGGKGWAKCYREQEVWMRTMTVSGKGGKVWSSAYSEKMDGKRKKIEK